MCRREGIASEARSHPSFWISRLHTSSGAFSIPDYTQGWADLMAGMSQEGAVPRHVAAAAEQVFHALVFGSLQDMAVGAQRCMHSERLSPAQVMSPLVCGG